MGEGGLDIIERQRNQHYKEEMMTEIILIRKGDVFNYCIVRFNAIVYSKNGNVDDN